MDQIQKCNGKCNDRNNLFKALKKDKPQYKNQNGYYNRGKRVKNQKYPGKNVHSQFIKCREILSTNKVELNHPQKKILSL